MLHNLKWHFQLQLLAGECEWLGGKEVRVVNKFSRKFLQYSKKAFTISPLLVESAYVLSL